jgi:hypothetical protein
MRFFRPEPTAPKSCQHATPGRPLWLETMTSPKVHSSYLLVASHGLHHRAVDGIAVLPLRRQAGRQQHVVGAAAAGGLDVLLVQAQPEVPSRHNHRQLRDNKSDMGA